MGQSLRRKQSAMQRNFKLRDLRLQMDGLEDGKQDLMFFKAIAGEEKSVTPEMTSSWLETYLPTILSRYDQKDIYNTDEFGLFYQAPSTKTMELKGEKCTGGKNGFISCFLLSLLLLF